MIKLIHGDCLEASKEIEDGSVDLMLTDPPYGTIKGLKTGKWKNIDTSWDNAIKPKDIYDIANRILRKNGKLILFSQEPYTSRLIFSAIPNMPFNYRMIWEKDNFANALGCKKAPVSYFEDILVFSKKECYEAKHPLREVMITYIEKCGKDYIIELFEKEGRYTSGKSARVSVESKFGTGKGKRFEPMNETLYEYLSSFIEFEETFRELKKIDDKYKQKFASTFNLWESNKYKSNILKYKKDYTHMHPTQKPILLLEDLIKTFSNKNNLVVDITMGSGSTGVACKNTNRSFTGIEMDDKYFNVANERINTNYTYQPELSIS